MANKIALAANGPKAGKSTLAKYLHEHYAYHIADHSLTLVKQYVQRFNSTFGDSLPVPLTVEAVYASKEAHRKGLHELSDTLGFTDKDAAAIWVHETLNETPFGMPVVFEPIRGVAQAKALKERGFVIVSIFIDESTRAQRCSSSEEYSYVLSAMQSRPDIEGELPLADIRLNGTLSVEVLAKVLFGYPNLEEMYPNGQLNRYH
jgi:dephospho-CoA kinase